MHSRHTTLYGANESLSVSACVTVRRCDILCRFSVQDKSPVVRNPHALLDQPLYPVQEVVSELLLKSRAFIKKVVEDNASSEDIRQLLLYLSFENECFSADLLAELLWQVRATALRHRNVNTQRH